MSTRARRTKTRTVETPVGRPSKLTPRVRVDVAAAFRTGATNKLAARMASISHDSLNDYRKQGEYDIAQLDASQLEALINAADAEVNAGKVGGALQTLPENIWTPFAKLFVVCERAQNVFGKTALASLIAAGLKGNSHATFGQLARVFPGEYSEPPTQVRVGNPDGTAIKAGPQFVVGRLILPDNNRPIKRPVRPVEAKKK